MPAGWQRNENDVTTPKLPPPPRIAQKSSGSRSASTATTEPSASTTVALTRLSIVSPYARVRWPIPPPSVRPPTPVVPMTPAGTAQPCSWVAASTWLSFAPPPTRTIRALASTSTVSIAERSRTSPSSTLPSPAPLWPPPRTATRSPRSRAKAMAAATSCSSTQYTIPAGCLSIIALYRARASSYPASSRVTVRPLTAAARPSIAVVDICVSLPRNVVTLKTLRPAPIFRMGGEDPSSRPTYPYSASRVLGSRRKGHVRCQAPVTRSSRDCVRMSSPFGLGVTKSLQFHDWCLAPGVSQRANVVELAGYVASSAA